MCRPQCGNIVGTCYRLNDCVLLKFMGSNLNLNVMVLGSGTFGRCLGDKGRALGNGISALRKESSLALYAM